MTDKLDAEIIVIGGGPAGIVTAKTLMEQGIDVLLIDMAKFPRRKVCAGGLAYHAHAEFPFVRDFVDSTITSYMVYSPNLLHACKIKSDEPYMVITKSRTDFDNRMMQMLVAMKCRIITGEKVENLHLEPNCIVVETDNGKKYSALTVVGADSAVSTVSRVFNIGLYAPNMDRNKWLGLAFERDYTFKNGPEEQLILHIILHFKGIRGYAWSFPRSIGTNLGLGGQTFQVKERKAVFKDFEEFAVQREMMPKDGTPSPLIMGILPNTYPYKHSVADRVVLVGDAGGFCANTTGDGIYYSMKSGKIVAEFLTKLVQKYRSLPATISSLEPSNLFLKSSLIKSRKALRPLYKELLMHYIISNSQLKNIKFCNTFIRWASYDPRLAKIAVAFLLGRVNVGHVIFKLGYQIIRCSILDLFHKLGDPKTDKNPLHT